MDILTWLQDIVDVVEYEEEEEKNKAEVGLNEGVPGSERPLGVQ